MTTEETHLDIENHTLMVNGERTAFALPNGTMIPLHPLVHGLPFEMQRLYAQTYANAYGDALKEQGAATFIQTQMSAALHEAGHVIVVASLGFNPTWSRIWAEPGGQWVGFTDADGPYLQVGTGSTADANITAAKGVMAGYIAERVFEGDDAKLGSSLDERVAAIILTSFAAAIRSARDGWVIQREAEREVMHLMAHNEAVARDIASALIDLSPNKLEGQALADLVARIPASAPKPLGRAEARRLRQMAKHNSA